MNSNYSNFTYKGVKIDPYRIFQIYGINHPACQHSIKKLLRAGRSHKTLSQDIQEAIDSLERWKEMIEEDNQDSTKPNIPENFLTCCVCGNKGGRHYENCGVLLDRIIHKQ